MSRFREPKDPIKSQLLILARKDTFGSIPANEKGIDGRRQLLDVVSNSEKLQRAVFPENEEAVPTNQQERNQEGKQELKQRQMETDGEDSEGSESDRQSQPGVDEKTDEDDHSNKEAHVRLHIGEHYDCSLCGRLFAQRQSLRCHLKTHTVQRTFSCTVCGKTFRKNANLKHCMKIHTGDKPFSCNECQITFRSSKRVKNHRCAGESSKLDSNKTKKTLNCPKYGETFPNRHFLKVHKKTHLNKKAFTCTVCGKHFPYTSQLKSHLIKHTRERQFSCSVCKRTFRWPSQVRLHKCAGEASDHDGDIPEEMHSCPKCDETFSNAALLRAHKKIHLEVCRCTVCGKQFRYSSQLKIHMRKHTGEKPYSCPICGKRFSQMGITKQHMFIHAKVRPFSCNDCGKRFTWHFQIKRHRCPAKYVHEGKTRGSETTWEPDSDRWLKRFVYNRPNASVETEDSDSDFWKETRKHQSGVTYQRNKKDSSNIRECITSEKHLSSLDKTRKLKNDNNADGEFCKEILPLKTGLNKHIKEDTSVSDAGDQPDEGPLESSKYCEGSEDRPHAVEKPFCSFYGNKCVTGGHLTRHLSVHMGQKLLSCIICHRAFRLESELMSHLCSQESLQDHQSQTEEHRTIKRLLSCSHCDEKFVLKEQLQIHIRRHTFKKRFKCSVCRESFARQEDLTFHFRRHIRCSVCNAVFGSRDSLVLHMRSHTLQTQFYCSVCGKDFAWRRHLIKHMEVHTSEKTDSGTDDIEDQFSDLIYSNGNPFRCPVCYAGLSDKESFNQHMKIHTRKTQFRYSVCRKDFTWKQHLAKQIQVQESRDTYSCSVCRDGFSCQNELSHHQCNNQSSELVATHLQPKVQEKASDSSDPDTDDSDFWKELSKNSVKSKVFQRDQGGNSDKTLESFKPHSDDSVDRDFWKETKRTQSNLTSVNDNEISESDTKRSIQQFFDREDTAQHTEGLREMKLEDPQIKEEPEETQITMFTFSPVPVKTEEDEEKPQSSQLHYSQTEENRDSVEGPEPAKNSDGDFGAVSFKSDDSVDSDFWKEIRGPQSGLNSETDSWKNSEEKPSESLQPERDDSDFWTEKGAVFNPHQSIEASGSKVSYENVEKPYSCSDCDQKFLYISHLKIHVKGHTEKRPFLCSVCGQGFPYRSHLKIHMRTHTGEKPFGCPVCGKKYAHKASMQSHMSVHTGENRYNCDVCDKSFAWCTELKYHQCVGEFPREHK
ncbi:uncharacterized protein [Leuresthes tenuis]|uniref:uncharacterized protein n=1 Tax=Leuresthes tenuis TaxID=355514 RepID=UPI003B50B7C6